MSTGRLVLPLESVQWRALYTQQLAAGIEFAGISHGLDAEAADSLTPDSGRLLLRCGGFDRWRSRREAEALKDGPDGLRRMDGRENPHALEADTHGRRDR